MGISNRDYYRQSGGGGRINPFSDMRSMSQQIVIFTVVAFILQLLVTVETPLWRLGLDQASPHEREFMLSHEAELDAESQRAGLVAHVSLLESWGSAEPRKVERGQVWRLLTYAFLHSRNDMLHIIFNMMALWSFGPLMESLWGRREFLAFYLTSAIFAGICHVILGLTLNVPNGAVGASGAIMGMLMAFAVYFPRHLVSVFVFTLEARYLVAIYIVWDSWPVLKMLLEGGAGGGRGTGVAHAAHLGGLAFGYLYCMLGWQLTRWMDRWVPNRSSFAARSANRVRTGSGGSWWNRWFKSRPNLKLHSPSLQFDSPKSLEAKVDEVLKKVKESGEESLTEPERDVLREASRRYKKGEKP